MNAYLRRSPTPGFGTRSLAVRWSPWTRERIPGLSSSRHSVLTRVERMFVARSIGFPVAPPPPRCGRSRSSPLRSLWMASSLARCPNPSYSLMKGTKRSCRWFKHNEARQWLSRREDSWRLGECILSRTLALKDDISCLILFGCVHFNIVCSAAVAEGLPRLDRSSPRSDGCGPLWRSWRIARCRPSFFSIFSVTKPEGWAYL
jgi:hypothetical protein